MLGLSPTEFWQTTPRELALIGRALSVDVLTPPDRVQLQALMDRFPDETNESDES